MSVIKVEGLTKSFKKYSRSPGLWAAFKGLFHREYELVEAVKGVSFEVKEGEILGYLGPNGAGKSTVIKMLTGVLYPDAGKVTALGLTPWLEREKYVRDIGVVFGQKSTLWFDLPPVDTFDLHRGIYEVPRKIFDKRLKELVDFLEVKDISGTSTRKLSLGERMRCEFINSMLHGPKILFLDEPTVGIDVVAKQRIREFIKRINREHGVTVILTTHDVGDVEELCDRIIIIDKGRHIYEGDIAQLKREFIKYKELVVEFESPVKSLRLPNVEVVSLEGVKAVLRVDIKRSSVSTVIQRLFDKFEVKDIDVNEQSVESIIRGIYEKKRETS